MSDAAEPTNGPLAHVDDWEESLQARYPAGGGKRKEQFRNYQAEERPSAGDRREIGQ